MEGNHHGHHSSWDINNTWDHTWWTWPPPAAAAAASTAALEPSSIEVVATSAFTTPVVSTAVAGGPVSTPTTPPGLATSPCLTDCKTSFANSIFPGDLDYDDVCRILSTKSPASRFVTLYVCDSGCGLTFSGPGQDRKWNPVMSGREDPDFIEANVNAIIEQCHRQVIVEGFESSVD
jgi:hypothetical protein